MNQPLSVPGTDDAAEIGRRAERVTLATGLGYTVYSVYSVYSVPYLSFAADQTTRIGIAFAYVGLGTLFYLLTRGMVLLMRKTQCKN